MLGSPAQGTCTKMTPSKAWLWKPGGLTPERKSQRAVENCESTPKGYAQKLTGSRLWPTESSLNRSWSEEIHWLITKHTPEGYWEASKCHLKKNFFFFFISLSLLSQPGTGRYQFWLSPSSLLACICGSHPTQANLTQVPVTASCAGSQRYTLTHLQKVRPRNNRSAAATHRGDIPGGPGSGAPGEPYYWASEFTFHT